MPTAKKVTLDDVWATIEQIGKAHQETEKAIQKMSDRVDLVSQNVGRLGVSMGDLIETLFAPHLGEKFDAYQYNLNRIFHVSPSMTIPTGCGVTSIFCFPIRLYVWRWKLNGGWTARKR